MIIKQSKTLSNGMRLSILEVDNPIAVKYFNNRYQVILEVNGKKIFPKNKNKFLEFEENNYIYNLKSDITQEIVHIDEVLAHELFLCDKNELDCMLLINEFCLQDTEELINNLYAIYKF